MTRTRIIYSSLLALAVIAIPAAGEQISEADEFSVNLPAECSEVKRQAQTIDSPSGPIENVTWVARGESGICIVSYSELTGPVIEPERMIDSGRDSLMKELGTIVDAEQTTEIDGFPGRTIEYTGTAGTRNLFGRTDFAIAHDRMYQVIFIGYSLDDRNAVEGSSYFSSISIQAPDLEKAEAEETTGLDESSQAESSDSEMPAAEVSGS